MARARSIKPGFFKNEELAECTLAARLLFIGLWGLADRQGRLEDRPKRIKAELFAYVSIEVEPLLHELASRGGFILRYRIGDLDLIQILNFGKHQNPHHREAPSILPAPEGFVVPTTEPEAERPSYDLQAPACTGFDPLIGDLAKGQNPADSGLLTPDSLFTDSGHSDPLLSSDLPSSGSAAAVDEAKPVKQKHPKGKNSAPTTSVTWRAYTAAFQDRYHVAPVSNAMVNGQLSNFVKRVGEAEAPDIAAFYVSLTDRFYTDKRHAVGLMVHDAETLRTRWATGARSANGSSRHNGFNHFNYESGSPDGSLT